MKTKKLSIHYWPAFENSTIVKTFFEVLIFQKNLFPSFHTKLWTSAGGKTDIFLPGNWD